MQQMFRNCSFQTRLDFVMASDAKTIKNINVNLVLFITKLCFYNKTPFCICNLYTV